MSEHPPTILVADDNRPMAAVLRFNLEQSGFRVIVANDGQEAWEALASAPVSMLVTDEQMPRLNGTELCARIRENPAYDALPIVMLTAKSFELEVDQLRQTYRLHDILPKPFSPRAVVQLAQRCLTAPACCG